MVGSSAIQRRLEAFSRAPLNFDPATLGESAGYGTTDVCHPLPPETPGDPTPHGSWEVARRLIADYAFAPPGIVRAYYDPAVPLEGRTMVLRLRALGVFRVFVGVRILSVTDETREIDGRRARVWGWTYGTLAGHVEAGEMTWETRKWLDTGEVDFHVHATSRPAKIRDPITSLGFHLLGPHERTSFLRATGERMYRLVDAGRESDGSGAAGDAAGSAAVQDPRVSAGASG